MADYKNNTSLKQINTRIGLKYDSLENWQSSTLVLNRGEVAFTAIQTKDENGFPTGVPSVLMKVGDGTKTWSQLDYVYGLAADVPAWAKGSDEDLFKNLTIEDGVIDENNIATFSVKYKNTEIDTFTLDFAAFENVDYSLTSAKIEDEVRVQLFADGAVDSQVKIIGKDEVKVDLTVPNTIEVSADLSAYATVEAMEAGDRALNEKIGELNTLTTDAKNTVVAAINEVQAEVIAADGKIDAEIARAQSVEGDLAKLATAEKTNLVAAINEVQSEIEAVDKKVDDLGKELGNYATKEELAAEAKSREDGDKALSDALAEHAENAGKTYATKDELAVEAEARENGDKALDEKIVALGEKVDNLPHENTTYELTAEGNKIVLTPSEGEADEITLSGDEFISVAATGNAITLTSNLDSFATKDEIYNYSIEVLDEANSGAIKSYKLVKTKDGVTTDAGSVTIDIPTDLVISSGNIVESATDGDVFEGAVAGHKYLELVIANQDEHLFIDVEDLVDVYKGQQAIEISNDNTISLKISEQGATNGLSQSNDGLSIGIATDKSNGVMTYQQARQLQSATGVLEGFINEVENIPVKGYVDNAFNTATKHTDDAIAALGDLASKDKVAKTDLTEELAAEIDAKQDAADAVAGIVVEDTDSNSVNVNLVNAEGTKIGESLTIAAGDHITVDSTTDQKIDIKLADSVVTTDNFGYTFGTTVEFESLTPEYLEVEGTDCWKSFKVTDKVMTTDVTYYFNCGDASDII